MARGEIKWSSKGKDVARFDKTPVDEGDYDLKFRGKKVKVKMPTEPGKLPYVQCPLEVLNSGTNGGPNKYCFHNFFLHLKPSPKDGMAMVERQGQILELARTVGQEVEFTGREMPYQKYDKNGDAVGAIEKMPVADPATVAQWIKSLDGAVVRGHVIIQRATKGYAASNKLDYFIPSDEAAEVPVDEDEEIILASASDDDEETTDSEEEGADFSDSITDDEEDEKPAVKRKNGKH